MADASGEDGVLRDSLAAQIRPSLAEQRELSDEELLQKLSESGADCVDRAWLDRATQQHWAAFMVADEIDSPAEHEDTVWLSIVCLWERWFSDRPSFEQLDDLIHDGYTAESDEETCKLWRSAWLAMLHIMEKAPYRSIEEFDDAFGAAQSIDNWVQEYESRLFVPSLNNSEFARHRIELSHKMINELSMDSLMTENFRRALAESHFVLGECEIANALFEQWLEDDPQWGWGWIGWSDAYFVFSPDAVEDDAERALAILHQALKVPGLQDKEDVLDRLATILEDIGQVDEGAAYRKQIEELQHRLRNPITGSGFGHKSIGPTSLAPAFSSGILPPAKESVRRVGRNEPCPCNSGKKFKKCCGRPQ